VLNREANPGRRQICKSQRDKKGPNYNSKNLKGAHHCLGGPGEFLGWGGEWSRARYQNKKLALDRPKGGEKRTTKSGFTRPTKGVWPGRRGKGESTGRVTLKKKQKILGGCVSLKTKKKKKKKNGKNRGVGRHAETRFIARGPTRVQRGVG